MDEARDVSGEAGVAGEKGWGRGLSLQVVEATTPEATHEKGIHASRAARSIHASVIVSASAFSRAANRSRSEDAASDGPSFMMTPV